MFGGMDFEQELWAARRGRRRHGGRGPGRERLRSHDDDGSDFRSRRMLTQGDLRLIILALIAEQPRHGYEIIKVIEDKTEGWYAPSPGIVYPTLTFLEESDYISGQMDGAKKLYAVTPEGRSHLRQNRALADVSLERLTAAAARYGRLRHAQAGEDSRGSQLSPLVRAAIENLRTAAAERLRVDAASEPKIVNVLAHAAVELRQK